jgi:hypothetical protein
MKRWISLLTIGFFSLVVFLVSCSPVSGPSEDKISTIVAATVMAAGSESSLVSPTATTGSPTITPSPAPIRVSFVSTSRNLFTWVDGSGSPSQLTSSGDVSESFVSSDGNLIAMIRNADYTHFQVDVINSDGTNQRTLLSTAQIEALPRPSGSLTLAPEQIVWIGDTHMIALNFRVLYEGPGLSFSPTLYLLDADTGVLSTLLTTEESWKFTYSPDASKLLISHPYGVDLYKADGSLISANVISHDFVNTASEYAWVSSPTWKADSTAFAVAIPPAQPWGDIVSPSSIFIWTDTGVSTISPISSVMLFSNVLASFSPDLDRVAYTSRVGAPADNTWALHIANLDGSNDSVVATGDINELPVWSPDGVRYIYSMMVGSSIQTYLNMDGGISMFLPVIYSLIDVRWIDNSRFIISTRDGSGNSLLIGTITGVFSVIYNDLGPDDVQKLSFDVNR